MIDLTKLKPKVARMATQLVAEAKKAGMPILITQGLRTKAEQDKLYAQGRILPGKIVTNAKGGFSLHNFGVAFDVAFLVGRTVTWNGDWKTLGKLGKSIGLEWGGLWQSFPDMPHFQYLAGYTLTDFQKGKIDESKFT